MEDLENLRIFGILWKFCNSSRMLLCRVTKFPSLNFQCLFLREKNTSACKPDIINPLSVSNLRSGKQRLILDLRHVKQFIYKQKFKFEDFGHRYAII